MYTDRVAAPVLLAARAAHRTARPCLSSRTKVAAMPGRGPGLRPGGRSAFFVAFRAFGERGCTLHAPRASLPGHVASHFGKSEKEKVNAKGYGQVLQYG